MVNIGKTPNKSKIFENLNFRERKEVKTKKFACLGYGEDRY